MADSLDMTDYDAFFKEYYPQHEIENAVVQVSPFFNDIKKTEYYGDAYIVPYEYSFHSGGAHTFSSAQSNRQPAKRSRFVVTDVDFHQEISIDSKVLKASASNLGAWAEARKREMDNALAGVGKKLARSIWRDKGATFGRLSGDPGTGTTFTLRNFSDAHFFGRFDLVEAHSTASGGTTRAGTPAVAAINRNTGIITVDAAINAAWADGDFLGVVGDYDLGPSGVQGWVPAADPAATAFFGVDRTADNEALAGWRIAGTAIPIWDSLLQATERVAESGGDMAQVEVYVHNRRFTDVLKEIGGKTTYRDVSDDAKIGKRSVLVDCSGGSVKLTADPFCDPAELRVMDKSTWEIAYRPDGFPHVNKDDGLTVRVSSNSDAILARMRAYYNVVCWGAIRNAVATLPTT
jgi:hypothetical protein